MNGIIKHDIEINGENGFDSYRVPGISVTATGTILLYYEGRKNDGSRTLLIKRSTDGGKSFTQSRVIAAPKDKELLHNPMVISAKDGGVYLFWCRDYGRLFLQTGLDDGETFSEIRDITSAIDGFRKIWPVTLWAISPGHGIEMKDGTLVLPLWLSKGENAHLPAAFGCLYSRDKGQSWQCSNVVPAANGVGDPTEASVCQRADGTLLATMRHEIPGSRRRAFCEGGPEKWGEAYLNNQLPDPICSGSLLTLPDGRLAFVNCAYGDEPALELQKKGENIRWSMDARQRLTLRLSEDGGNTWSDGLLLEQESGASDLALGSSGKEVLCFYEQGWDQGNCIFNRKLVLAQIPAEILK